MVIGSLLLFPTQVFAMLPAITRAPATDSSTQCDAKLPPGVTRVVVPANAAAESPSEQPRESWSDCIVITDHRAGDNCGSRDSFSISLRNACSEPIDARFCIERSNGTWDCGMYSDMQPGERTSYYTCHSTFYVWRWARQAGTNTPIPQPRHM